MPGLATATPVAFIMTRDPDVSRRFYAETLGLRLGVQDDFATVYDLAGTILRITHISDYVASAHPALGWQVDDIEVEATALAAKGVSFTIYEGLGQDARGIWTAPDGGAKVAWFNDPDGNVLSLTQS
jgi:catechol 2,3-dioxygenase-like lactoylglutathione lyase family enzyme